MKKKGTRRCQPQDTKSFREGGEKVVDKAAMIRSTLLSYNSFFTKQNKSKTIASYESEYILHRNPFGSAPQCCKTHVKMKIYS